MFQLLHNLDLVNLKNVPTNLKNDLMRKEVVKNTTFNKLNTKVNSLENNIPAATTLIHINQYSTDKQSLGENIH